MRRWVILRRLSQTIFFLLFVFLLLAAPRLVSGAVDPAVIFHLDPLITIIGSISERCIFPGLLLSLAMLLLTVLLGRFFCGWVCPMGAALDLIGIFARKNPLRNDTFNKRLRKPKYFLLAVIFLAALAGIQIAWLFDPTVIMSRLIIFKGMGWTLIFFLAVALPALFIKRFWCRALCPLGALYSIFSRFKWKIGKDRKGRTDSGTGISRRNFLFLLASSFFLLGFKNKLGRFSRRRGLIRPPAALEEEEFLGRCIRCGNCMNVCVTNGLQPAAFQAGLDGLWTPRLVPEIGHCDYNCNRCGNVCPTAAIRRLPLDEKRRVKLGLAEIDKTVCVAWAHNQHCLICMNVCPVSGKAIEAVSASGGVLKPRVKEDACIGCGACQNKCPARPVRAIKVRPV